MTIYRLYFILSNNAETGSMTTIDIAESTNKQDIDAIISDYALTNVKSEADRGEHHIFIYDSYTPIFSPYFNGDKLNDILKELI